MGAPGLQLAFPWITRGEWSLEDYNPEFLDQFESIVMWEPIIKDLPIFEERIRGLLAAGKQVVINPGRIFGSLAFGVSSSPVAVEGTYTAQPTAGSDAFKGIGRIGPFSYFGGGWRGHMYDGIDGTEATLVRPGADTIPLLSYKEVEGHRLYFDGADLFLLVAVNKDEGAITFLEELLGRVKPNTETVLQPLVSTVELGQDYQRVTVDMPHDGWTVFSESFSPAWRMTRDGKPVPYYPFENMMSFPLPKGQHTLELSYGMTPIQKVSLGLSIVSLALLGVIAILFRLQRVPWRDGPYPALASGMVTRSERGDVWYRRVAASERSRC